MEENFYLVSSITYALKGQTYLQNRGYKAYVIRDRDKNPHGCGYAIAARGNRNEISALLAEGHVKVAEVRGEL